MTTLYTITHLKAPWPAGAAAGDVIDLGDTVPAWALGKCRPAPEGAKATVKLGAGKAAAAGDDYGAKADKATAANPVAREQAAAETPEQQAQREREQADAQHTAQQQAERAKADATAKKHGRA